jgi:hypothetical protein
MRACVFEYVCKAYCKYFIYYFNAFFLSLNYQCWLKIKLQRFLKTLCYEPISLVPLRFNMARINFLYKIFSFVWLAFFNFNIVLFYK